VRVYVSLIMRCASDCTMSRRGIVALHVAHMLRLSELYNSISCAGTESATSSRFAPSNVRYGRVSLESRRQSTLISLGSLR
jgi:hypothetical protein